MLVFFSFTIDLSQPVATIIKEHPEVKELLINLGQEAFTIEPGMRIAQMVVAKYETVEWDVVTELDETERGAGGYGSTGHATTS